MDRSANPLGGVEKMAMEEIQKHIPRELPRKLDCYRSSVKLCRAIGIRFDGVDQGRRVLNYDMDKGYITRRVMVYTTEGWVQTMDTERVFGKIEPYWR